MLYEEVFVFPMLMDVVGPTFFYWCTSEWIVLLYELGKETCISSAFKKFGILLDKNPLKMPFYVLAKITLYCIGEWNTMSSAVTGIRMLCGNKLKVMVL